jgi:molybdopterin-guanine dinucleotide biosynthesis protein A
MGTDKALLKLPPDGPTLIERVISAAQPVAEAGIVVVTNHPGKYQWLGLPVVTDNYPGSGPLAGLEAGLAASKAENNFLLACDMPFVQTPLLNALLSWAKDTDGKTWDAVVPLNPEGKPEPLCALYNARVLPVAREYLTEQMLKMSDFLSALVTRYVEAAELKRYDPDLNSFKNLNTPWEMSAVSLQGKASPLQITDSR